MNIIKKNKRGERVKLRYVSMAYKICNSYIMYNLNPYMSVIVIVFNCIVRMDELYTSLGEW